jgi:LysR family glycine cleavage system transcriptional activator
MNWQELPSLTALRAFAAVSQTGGLTQAGRALNVSHAAVSQQMRVLEDRLGTTLVTREGRSLALTPAGTELARALTSAFGEIEAAVAALTGQDRTRPLQISVTPTFAASWLMPRLPDFQRENPRIDVMINPTAEVVPLAPGGVDVAIRFGKGDWPTLEVETLILTDIAVVASPCLLRGRRLEDPAALLDLPWLQEAGTSEVTTWLARRGIDDTRRVRLTQLPGNLVLEALRRGDGVSAAVPRVFVDEDIAAGRLTVLFEEHEPGTGYHIVTRPGVARPPLRAFLAWLRRQKAPSAPV